MVWRELCQRGAFGGGFRERRCCTETQLQQAQSVGRLLNEDGAEVNPNPVLNV